MLLAAIVAGYWDMLSSEKLRVAQRGDPAEMTDGAAGEVAGSETVDAAPVQDDSTEMAAANSEADADTASPASQDADEPSVAEGDAAASAPSDVAPSVAGNEEVGQDAEALRQPETAQAQADVATAGEGDSGSVEESSASTEAGGVTGSDVTSRAASTPSASDYAGDSPTSAAEAVAETSANAGEAGAGSTGTGDVGGGTEPLAGTASDGENRTVAGASETGSAQDGDAAANPTAGADVADVSETPGDGRAEDGASGDPVTAVNESGNVENQAAANSVDAAAAAKASDGDAGRADGEAAAASADAPRFDLLRVEPDGSTIIAGRAPAESRIALMSGETVLGGDTAGIGGDFAVVLDAPLPPGDHAITIRATLPDGTVSRSQETAIVSVPPRDRPGELLAMVEAPNAPTRLIEMPAAGGDAAAPGAASEAAQPALPAEAASPSEAEAVKPEPADAAGASPTPSETAARLPAEGASAPADTAAEGTPSVAVPAEGSADSAASTSDETDVTASDAPVQPGGAVMLPRDRSADAVPSSPSTVPLLRVEAVEVEGSQVYIAGAAERGARVRVYVDNVFLAEDEAGFGDRFLVTGDTGMSVGEHLVRADQISPDGRVVARAEVPFTRPEGATAAAVAPAQVGAPQETASEDRAASNAAESTEEASSASEPDASPTMADVGNASQAADSAGPVDMSETSPEAGKEKSSRVTIANANETGAGTPDAAAAASAEPTAGVSDAGRVTARDAAGEEADAAAAVDAASGASDGSSPTVAASKAPESAVAATGPEQADTERPQTNPAGSRAGDQPEAETAADGDEADVPVNRQPALANADGRVIIRKGDTLWEISRRTYGEGQRYTVIYLANGDQIRDPDLIYPAQVFRLPETPADGDAGATEAKGDGEG
ncbi:LysM peptidoglycan-binding domain-containing protein [Aurantimonas coralicida]|uniref:LysM peptidoglycan-binding domain-containing protein n=1 Tax=Aurantimonas coralicida TaxID=182270 RepID=UPI001E63F674|nr:LysM peptidoglycan-binding domain-containing protein [Aurantimonas coralicida]MCD1644185.1 LysM peptidoglycan-binding domain-containing protein [Aurantimonas coralicida]